MSTNLEIAKYIGIDRLEYLDRQEALFDQAKPSLLAQYLSEFIAFEDNIILDHDKSEKALVQRVYAKSPNQDILIRQVLEHEPRLMVRGANFSSDNA